MKKLVLLAILFIATTALRAQTDTLVTMKSSAAEVDIQLNWTPTTAVVKVNGVVVARNTQDTVPVNSGGTVFITTDNNAVLTQLICYSNQLTELDVSKNTALTRLNCDYNQLDSLDVSKNTALTYLACGSNNLSKLDVSKNTALTNLQCQSNQLKSLDVSKNTALEHLYCNQNQLTGKLDVSKNTALRYLNCYINQLTALDVTNNTALEQLVCRDNQLTALDVTNNTALTYLNCGSNQLSSLDLSKNTLLTNLNASYQKIKIITNKGETMFINPLAYKTADGKDSVQIAGKWYKHNDMVSFTGSSMSFTSNKPDGTGTDYPFSGTITIENTLVTMKSCSTAVSLYANWTPTTAVVKANGVTLTRGISTNAIPVNADSTVFITAAGSVDITSLSCTDNKLIELDVSKATALRDLWCDDNLLTKLDVSKNTNLYILSCPSNQLTALDVNNLNLEELYCYNNYLTELDLSNHTNLYQMECYSNHIANLKFPNNTILTSIMADNQSVEVIVMDGETTFANPIYFYNKTTAENVIISGVPYAYKADITLPAVPKDTLHFTSTSDFSGVITIVSCVQVTFNSNGGTLIGSKVVKQGGVIGVVAVPTRTGYTFAGWYKDDNTFTHRWNLETDLVSANVTLHAKWTEGEVGINEVATEQLSVYPNPTTGKLKVENGKLRMGEVKVFTVTGQLVRTAVGSEIDLAGLPNGVYIIQAGNARTRVVKN